MFDFDFTPGKKAPLNWCPECGNKLKPTIINFKDGSQANCRKCQTCGYMHDLEFINTVPPVDPNTPPEDTTPIDPIPPIDPNNGPAPLPEDDDEDTGFIPPVW